MMLVIGDIVEIKKSGYGFCKQDIGKFVEIIDFGDYYTGKGYKVGPVYQGGYDSFYTLEHHDSFGIDDVVGPESFGIYLNILDEGDSTEDSEVGSEYSLNHYDTYYILTEKDIEAGKIKVDAYWVAKQWKTGSKDDSGALWHSLKTIARFGEKNSKEREIKALYNQAIALARIYNVEL